jgi:hypothetical protein
MCVAIKFEQLLLDVSVFNCCCFIFLIVRTLWIQSLIDWLSVFGEICMLKILTLVCCVYLYMV